MNITKGHGLLLSIPFADGGACSQSRTFLVIDNNEAEGTLTLLNVSSTSGKEWKLAFDSNFSITNYWPPFRKQSFVKLDAIYTIEYFPELDRKVLAGRRPLDALEHNAIDTAFQTYCASGGTTTNVRYDVQIVKVHNPELTEVSNT